MAPPLCWLPPRLGNPGSTTVYVHCPLHVHIRRSPPIQRVLQRNALQQQAVLQDGIDLIRSPSLTELAELQ